MYERGRRDAEHGDPQPFYYQHYYHYRRGYDEARRRLLRPGARLASSGVQRVVIAIMTLVAIGAAVMFFMPPAPQAPAAILPTPTLPPEPTTTPRRTPVFPTRTPVPTPTIEPLELRVGRQAQIVNTEGRPLRARAEPGLKARVVTAFAEGEQVRILGGPTEADGYIWWQLEGAEGIGWSAQQSLEGLEWLRPVANSR